MIDVPRHPNHATARSPFAHAALLLGTCGICLIAVMRTLIVFTPRLYFDVDPAVLLQRFAGMGTDGSLLLDVLLLLSAGCLLCGVIMTGRRISASLLMLTALGGIIVFLHGFRGLGDAAHLARGSHWFAAVLAALALAHLPRGSHLRLIAFILLLSVLAPLAVRGCLQMTLEHQDTLQQFEQQKQQYYQSRGWDSDSAQARIFERRLRQAQPRGWFETTNILASIAIVMFIVFASLTWVSVRQKFASGYAGLTGLCALLATAALWLSGSRGAMLAGLGATVLLVAPLIASRLYAVDVLRRCRERAGLIAMLAITAAFIGILVRGIVLPESFANEKSLLFRWHYLLGAVRMLTDHAWIGVGPAGFQDAYMLYRPQRSPEEVTSTHNIFFDWLAGLGLLGGLAWSIVVLTLLWKSGSAARDAESNGDGDTQHTPEHASADLRPRIVVIGMLITIIAGGIALSMEYHALDPLLIMLRLFGLLGMFLLVLLLAQLQQRLAAMPASAIALVRWSITVAAIGLLVHGQIEMTFVQPGSAVWALCFVGLVCCVSRDQGEPPERADHALRSRSSSTLLLTIVLLTLGCSALLLFRGVLPAAQQQREIARAAHSLSDLPVDRSAIIAARLRAADTLRAAHERWPANPLPLLDAIEQIHLAASMSESTRRLALLNDAVALAEQAVQMYPQRNAPPATLALITWQRAAAAGSDANWQDAINAARTLTVRDPHAITSWARYGDVLWSANRWNEAIAAYQTALRNNENFQLDPLKQLSEAQRRLIERRVQQEPLTVD